MQGKLITIFGGGGFLGTYIAQRLMQAGARVRIAERNILDAQHIKPLGNLGQSQFVPCDIRHEESVRRALHGADMAINLVGTFSTHDYDAVHIKGAENVARLAKEAGCEALCHISAIGADPNAECHYGRSKGMGETRVLSVFPEATILRPSVVFGREDQFINRFAGMVASLPVVPIICPDAQFQPVFVDDVAQAVTKALSNHGEHGCKIYELAGPDIVTMAGLQEQIAAAIGVKPLFVNLPNAASAVIAAIPGSPLTLDQYKMLHIPNVKQDDMPGFNEIGIEPRAMAAIMADQLVMYRKHGRFAARAAQG